MTLYSLLLDITLASLLVIAILYCWRLDNRLKTLRSGGEHMIEAARELQTSVDQAKAAVELLRASAGAAGRELQAKIDEARALAAQAPRPARTESDVTLRRRSSS